MATLCTNCGTALPADNARFCSKCGTFVPSQPLTSRSSANAPGNTSSGSEERSGSLRREQIAHTSSDRLAGKSDTPPAWMNQLERGDRKPVSFHPLRGDQPGKLPDATVGDRAEKPASKAPEKKDIIPPDRAEKLDGEKSVNSSQFEQGEKRADRPVWGDQSAGKSRPGRVENKSGEIQFDHLADIPTVTWPATQSSQPPASPKNNNNPVTLDTPQLDFPGMNAVSAPRSSSRELRVKVWDQETREEKASGPKGASPIPARPKKVEEGNVIVNKAVSPVPRRPQVQPEKKPDEVLAMSNAAEQATKQNDQDVDELPTRPLMTSIPGIIPERQSTPPPSKKEQASRLDDMERLDTVPLMTPSAHKMTPTPLPGERAELRGASVQTQSQHPSSLHGVHTGGTANPVTPIPSSPRPHPQSSLDGIQSAQLRSAQYSFPGIAAQERPHATSTATIERHLAANAAKRKSPVPLFAGVAVLFILLAVSITWIIATNPFSEPQAALAFVSLQDTKLHISLSYPAGWTTHEDVNKGVLRLSDSTQTDQLRILMAQGSSDAAQYAHKEASQAGMTALKSAPALTFAGASWEQIEGTVQQNGATYTAHMFVTQHGGQMYTLMQLAPQVTYQDAERVYFSPVRQSLHFT